jgi:hypothetical protein
LQEPPSANYLQRTEWDLRNGIYLAQGGGMG